MKTLIAIPSYNRPYEIEKRTLYWVRQMNYHWAVFVYESQAKYYRQITGRNHIVTCEDGLGLVGKMKKVHEYAELNNYDLVLKIDDDMKFSRDGAKKTDAAQVCTDYLDEVIPLFNEEVGLINVAKPMSYRYGPKEGFKIRKSPIYGNYLVRTSLMKNLRAELLLFDDLWVSVETKLAGLKILQYMGAYEDAITHKNAGGLQSYDRDELGRRSYEYAKTIYPKIEILKDSKHKKFDISVKNYF
jgi:hypothetical protein